MTRIISQLSVQHAAVNYPLSDYAEYTPNLPTKLYNDTRLKEGEFSKLRLPNIKTASVSCVTLLWSRARESGLNCYLAPSFLQSNTLEMQYIGNAFYTMHFQTDKTNRVKGENVSVTVCELPAVT